MAQTPPKGDTDELELDWLLDSVGIVSGGIVPSSKELRQRLKRAIRAYASQREIEVLERTQRDFVHGESSEAFDEGRQYEQFLNRQLINELKKQKEEQPDVR